MSHADYDTIDDSRGHAGGEPPTLVRFLVIGATMAMAVLLYLDRFCVSFAADFIREDLDLSQAQIADFLGAFFWSYALAQVPSGWLSDRYGARIMLVVYILSWSVFTALIGAATSFVLLLSMRLACGLGQAGAYPTSASVVSKWVPFSFRGTASSLVAFGGRVGGAFAPLLTASLIFIFVPLDTPVELQPTELLHGPRLAAMLAPVGLDAQASEEITVPGAVGRHVWSLIPQESQSNISEAAAHFRSREAALADREDGAQLLEEESLSATVHQELLDGMNGLLDRNDLYDAEAFADVKIAGDALKYLHRVESDEPLSEAERRRFNRLLLEAAFRHEVGKLYVKGWKPVMFVYGLAGLFVAGLFWVACRNRPEEHPWANEAECRLIERGRPAGAPSPHGKAGMAPIVPLLKSVSMWADCLMQLGTNIGWVFLVTWLPRYLYEVHQVPLIQRGWMATIPLMVGFCGMLIGGWLTDRWTAAFGVKWGRRGPLMITRFMAAIGYMIVLGLAHSPTDSVFNSPWAFVAAFSLVAMSTDMGTAANWAFKQDVGGRYVGSVLGWGNMWGNLGAACSPLIYNYFLGETPSLGDWNSMFLVCMGAFVFAGLCGILIDATQPIAPPDSEDDDWDVDGSDKHETPE